jgi:hypothetical protein
MKAKIIPIIACFSFFSILFNSCEDTTYKEYVGYAPVYMTYKDLRNSVSVESSADLKNPGKIYFKDNFIFIVEELKGIHVFDNMNPSLPVNKTFVKLPGVIDISISGSIMYADSYVDLVVLDLANVDNIHEVGRVKDIFPFTVPAVPGTDYPVGSVDKEKGVVVKWELRTIKEKVEFNSNPYPVFYKSGAAYMDMVNSSGASSGVSGSGVGLGGSMARFGIKGKILYVVDKSMLKIFDLTNNLSPSKINELNPGWNVETMFLTEKFMFLGTTTGMAIFDISDPATPVSKTFFNHARSCDPVVVDDTLAYITLRTGTNCGGNVNCLDIVNIKDISKPATVVSYPMSNPHGLGKNGNLLFICDGTAGLKIYDATDPRQMLDHLVYAYPDIKAFDVIPIGKLLILIGNNGLYQYNYSNIQNINLLSTIPVVKN